MKRTLETQAKSPKNKRFLLRENREQFFSKAFKNYTTYCKKRHITSKNMVGREELSAIEKEIFKSIADGIIETEGGVVVKQFGYFCVLKYPKKRTATYGEDRPTKRKFFKNGYTYNPIFVPYQDDSDVKFWSMDYNFSDTFKKRLQYNLAKGAQYKNYLFSLWSLLRIPRGFFKTTNRRTNV